MLRFISASVNPPLPMTGYFRRANSEFGTYEFSAQTIQPANHAVLFEVSPTLGDWVPLAWFSPYPVEQPVFAGLYSYSDVLFIRATATPSSSIRISEIPGEFRVVEAMSIGPPSTAGPRVNPALRGARAWVGK